MSGSCTIWGRSISLLDYLLALFWPTPLLLDTPLILNLPHLFVFQLRLLAVEASELLYKQVTLLELIDEVLGVVTPVFQLVRLV